MRIIYALLVYPIWFALAQSQPTMATPEHEHPVPEKLGSVSFPTSCSADVQQEFERAVALLHSFAYSAAEKAFGSVLTRDPNCAMAHWGVAMTYLHQLWHPYLTSEDAARGQIEIAQAERLSASDRERRFVEALKLVYTDPDSIPYPKRARDYALAMAKLAQANPDDIECQVFYALALIATASPTDKTHANENKAVDLLEPLFQKHPQHPGIAHYLIHACDNSQMASRGLPAAETYSKVAPSAPHALHMPSHIYTRLGMWEQSIGSNVAARKAAHVQGDVGEELHAMDYLTYAYLQLGRDSEAAHVIDDLRQMSNLHTSEFKIGYAVSAMPARYALERQQWAEAARLEPIGGTESHVAAITIWARAIGLARSGKPEAARRETEQLETAYEKVRAGNDDYWRNQVDVQVKEASAWTAHAEGKNDEAIKLLRDAAEEEDAVEKRPVTPGAIVPAQEQLGDLLLKLNQFQDAEKAFERSLSTAPQRRAALLGKKRAEEAVSLKKRDQS